MRLPWLAWPLVAAVLVMGLARAASCEGLDAFELETLLDDLSGTPDCPTCATPPPPQGWWIDLSEPEGDEPGDVFRFRVLPGYSAFHDGLCWILRGRVHRGERMSPWVEMRRREDCMEGAPAPDLLSLLSEGPVCHECPTCAGPWGFDAAIEIPDHARPGDVIRIELRPRYLKRGGKAAELRARLDREGRQSGVWGERIQPEDAVPEPPVWAMVVGGVGVLAFMRRTHPARRSTN